MLPSGYLESKLVPRWKIIFGYIATFNLFFCFLLLGFLGGLPDRREGDKFFLAMKGQSQEVVVNESTFKVLVTYEYISLMCWVGSFYGFAEYVELTYKVGDKHDKKSKRFMSIVLRFIIISIVAVLGIIGLKMLFL